MKANTLLPIINLIQVLLEFNFLSKVCGVFFPKNIQPPTHYLKNKRKNLKTHTQKKHTFVLEIVPGLYFDIFSNLTNHSVCFLLPIQIKPRRNFFTYSSQCQKTTLCQGKGHSSIMYTIATVEIKCSSGPCFKDWPIETYLIRPTKLGGCGKIKKYKIYFSHQTLFANILQQIKEGTNFRYKA